MKTVLTFSLLLLLYIIAISYPVKAEENNHCSEDLAICYSLCNPDANCQRACDVMYARCLRG